MAKQKLTPDKRAELRKELSERLSAGEEQSTLLKSLAEKYEITTEGLRWYMKSANGAPKAAKRSARRKAGAVPAKRRAAREPARKAPKARRPKRHPKRKARARRKSQGLSGLLARLTDRGLRRLLAARKLVPSLKAAQRGAARLKARFHAAGRQFRAAAVKVKRISGRIKALSKV